MKKPSSVLIADDEAHIRLMLRKLFQGLGITDIREAENGVEACRLYGESPSDFVVMDINMPKMDGLDALKNITTADNSATVVMLTSVGTRQSVESSVAAGASYYIRKDTPLAVIKEKFTQLLEELFDE